MINKIAEISLVLPDSIKVVDRSIIVSESGRDRVLVFLPNRYFYLGSEGVGKYRFKEPVSAYIQGNDIYVCDWFNHRIVHFHKEIFVRQIGVPGLYNRHIIYGIKHFFKSLLSVGTYTKLHFNESKNASTRYKLTSTLYGVFYYLTNFRMLVRSVSSGLYINKPNDCVVLDNYLYISQKDNRCVSIFDLSKEVLVVNLIAYPDGVAFGRLGQMCEVQDKIYFCDETNGRIGIIKDMNVVDFKLDFPSFRPFSVACSIEYFAVCGMKSWGLYDRSWNLLHIAETHDEYHGIAIDNNSVYLVNRSAGKIEMIDINEII